MIVDKKNIYISFALTPQTNKTIFANLQKWIRIIRKLVETYNSFLHVRILTAFLPKILLKSLFYLSQDIAVVIRYKATIII